MKASTLRSAPAEARTFEGILALFGAGDQPEPEPEVRPEDMLEPIQPIGTATGRTTRIDPFLDRTNQPRVRRGRGLQASVSYDERRTRVTKEVETNFGNDGGK